jgi:hypothetical protein
LATRSREYAVEVHRSDGVQSVSGASSGDLGCLVVGGGHKIAADGAGDIDIGTRLVGRVGDSVESVVGMGKIGVLWWVVGCVRLVLEGLW